LLMPNEYKQILRYGFGMLAVVAGLLLLFFISWPPHKLQPVFEAFNSENDWLLPWNRFTGTYTLKYSHYWLGLVFYALVATGSLAALWLINFKRPAVNHQSASAFKYFTTAFIQKWRSFSSLEKKAVILTGILLTGFRLYFLFQSRIGLDDSLSYILFIDKGLPAILYYYPLPNNHIFYNILCWSFRFIFSDPFWVMILPAFLIATIGSVLIYFAS